MFKIDTLPGQNLALSDRHSNKNERARHEDAKPSEGDSVVISEEGKKKHIMGQLMARISEQNGAKKP
ncbi:MAG: hypothetical protein HY956_07285 [Deltaproteobacteria bacterium]|nr:hypothetical protein [Deltaproteobacteria bacterium]